MHYTITCMYHTLKAKLSHCLMLHSFCRYHITSSAGSGEFALSAILAPGAYARRPLFHRLADLKMPTVFIYGEEGKDN